MVSYRLDRQCSCGNLYRARVGHPRGDRVFSTSVKPYCGHERVLQQRHILGRDFGFHECRFRSIDLVVADSNVLVTSNFASTKIWSNWGFRALLNVRSRKFVFKYASNRLLAL